MHEICSKDISIICRYLFFIVTYMYSYDKNFSIYEYIDYIIDDIVIDHIEHISKNIGVIEFLFEKYKIQEQEISNVVDKFLKKNTTKNMGIIGNILKLIILEVNMDNKNTHLVMNDYFAICNMIDIPTSYIKMINKIVKSIYNH